jgi:hypothetical protein
MGNTNSINKISFKDMQFVINNENYIIINTLNESQQICLIKGTTTAQDEILLFNNHFSSIRHKSIVIYGSNTNCDKLFHKYKQIESMGFNNVYIYIGGLFEWLLLQDIYGDDIFPTTSKDVDILNYKPVDIINNLLLIR